MLNQGMGSNERGRRSKSGRESSVIGYITVYKYGKMFSPVCDLGTRPKSKVQRSICGLTSKLFDRPGLISKIHHLLDIHRKRRAKNISEQSLCSAKFHKEMLAIIRTCYEENICESRLFPVGELLSDLLYCTSSSEPVFSILLNGQGLTSMHVRSQMDKNILYNQSDNEQAFEYYLHHICSARRLSYGSVDYLNTEIDPAFGLTPLSAAVQKRDPGLLLILLRYGADPFIASVYSDLDDRTYNPVEQLIDDLNGLFLFKNSSTNKETCATLAAEEAKVWQCLMYIRRCVSGIPLKSTTHIVTSYDDDAVDDSQIEYMDDRFLAKQMYGVHPGIAKLIDFSFFKPTVSLKHQCRCAIRSHLQQNQTKISSLPKAISSLPLPTKLKEYLDLQTD